MAGTPTLRQMQTGSCSVVDREGNLHHGPQIDGYPRLKADGSTASGCWIYSGVLGPDKINKANSRKPKDYLGHGWGFAWPGDRRIIYNRASAGPMENPWSERKKLIWWDQAQKKWTGVDVPDFPLEKSPEFRPDRKRKRARGDSRRRAIHVARRRPRLALRSERFAGRADADALRTARVAGAQRALLARHKPGRQLVYPPGKSVRAAGRSAISICPHDLPADRAPHRRRHVALSQSSRGVTAGAVRGNVSRSLRPS